MCIVRIRKGKISQEILPASKLDPEQQFRSLDRFFYTNNVPYWRESNGQISRVRALAEHNEELRKANEDQK